MSKFRLSIVAACTLVSLGAAACSTPANVPYSVAPSGVSPVVSSPDKADGAKVGATVNLTYFSFGPAVVTIQAGQAVVWKWNMSGYACNVSFADFSSPTQTSGTFEHVFYAPGTYPYECTVQPNMKGEVIVEP
jgi:plastocyanin